MKSELRAILDKVPRTKSFGTNKLNLELDISSHYKENS
jgi:hypothetical protein